MNDTVIGNPDCADCPLNATAQYVCLMGRGQIPAKIMVVGEAPGDREDDVGKPFQGRAGKLLEKVLLEHAGLKWEQLYITNAVKCRPPENRTPKAKEVKACKPYLLKEIEEVRPKFVLLLGATALKSVLGKAKITDLHGEPIVKDGITYFPTFHPASALRDPKRLPTLEYDIQQFSKVLKGQKLESAQDVLKFEVVRDDEDFERMVRDLADSVDTSYDSETTGLDRFMEDGAVNVMSFASDTSNWVLPLNVDTVPWRRKPKLQRRMVETILQALSLKVRRNGRVRPRDVYAQNGKFDNLWFHQYYGVRFPMSFDTMLAHALIDENLPSGLKFLARHYLQAPNYDVDKKTKTGVGDLQKLYLYAALDAYYTRKLGILFKQKLKEDDSVYKLFRKMVMPAARAFEQIEINGVYLDVDRMDLVKIELESKLEACMAKLKKMAGEEINWNSPQQVRKILFEKLKLKARGKTPGGDASTAENLLSRMKAEHPIIQVLLDYRESQKLHSSFIQGWQDRIHNERYLNPSFKLNGAVTGRPSCEDPNLQQVPRNKTIRSLISAPDGWTFFECDYSQVELRVAAILSGDREMLRIFQTGGDIHLATAAQVSGIPEEEVADEDRKKAKAVNFGFLYGMGWRKFMDYALDKYGVTLNERQSQQFRKRFFEKYADLPKWHDRQRRIVRSLGQVRTLTGRIRHLPDINSEEKGLVAQAERNAINSPVQGFAAEMTLMAVVSLATRFSPDELQLCGTIHDAIVGRVRKRRAKALLREFKQIMEHPPLLDEFGIDLPVPIVVDVKTGNWGNGVKLKFGE